MPSAAVSTARPNPVQTVVRPAGAAVLLLAAVAVTALVLYAFWPAGVAVGVVLGSVAVIVLGARMQLADRMQPTDLDLAERLGVATAPAPAVVAQPEAESEAPVEVPAAPEPVLHAQADVLYFTSDDDPDVVEVREVVTAANDIIVVPQQEPAPVEPTAVEADQVEADQVDPVRADLEQLKADLGSDYSDFARAARLVVSTQYASAARLQRDLDLPYSRARRLLSDLEELHFVGPATGSLPRRVLLPKERLPEVEALLADA